MAGVGPAPKQTRARKRDNVKRDVVKHDGLIGGFDLPDDVLPLLPESQREHEGQRESWNKMTVAWWQAWRESPQAAKMVTLPDWYYMLDTALMHHQMWESGGKNSERAAEIRLRVAAFGATPADRLRLRLEIEVPEQYPAGATGRSGNVTDIGSRRSRLTGG